MIIFIGFLGLAVDWLYTVRTAQELQTTADAAALAGAQLLVDSDVPYDEVCQRAIDLASRNVAAGQNVRLVRADVAVGSYDRKTHTFKPIYRLSMLGPGIVTACHTPPYPTPTGPNAVSVVARRASGTPSGPLPLFFGPIFGVKTVDISRSAIAMINRDTSRPGILVLDEDDQGTFHIGGSASYLDVRQGSIQVNSSHDRAATHSGQPSISAIEINVVGGLDNLFERQVETWASINTGQAPIPDPLASLRGHRPPTLQDKGTVTVTGREVKECTPGYYSGGMTMTSSNAKLILHRGAPGTPSIYVLDGVGLNVSGGTLEASEGVLIYVIDSTPNNNKKSCINLTGNGTCRIRPINEGSLYDGLALWQDYDNHNDSTVTGTGRLDVRGTLYFPESKLNLRGTSDSFGNQLIVGKLDIQGNGNLTINYDGRNPDPTAGRPFLVE